MQFDFKLKYLAVIILLISGYFFLLTSNILNNHTLCIFKTITGIPCPSCGSTRATLLLFHGDLKDSLLLNPFAVITNSLIFISIGWMISDILKNKETFLPFLKKDWDYRIKIVLIIVVSANWIWNIVKGL
jgi:Protein of unknown function (DUF2752)